MRISKIFKKFTILYKIYKENKEIEKQIPYAELIYDSILSNKSKDEILKKIPTSLSKELVGILNKVFEIPEIVIKEKMTGVSVVIPHYNQHECLSENLYHLKEQSCLPDQIIVVDDMSNEQKKLRNIINKYNNDLNIELIRSKQKLYTGAARQLGAEHAKFNVIMVHDADDISHWNRIELTKKFFKEYPNAVQLTVGYVTFRHPFFDFIRKFDGIVLKDFIIDTKTILSFMRYNFVKQNFSVLTKYTPHYGFYGVETKYGGVHAGHVAYRKEVVGKVNWPSKGSNIFSSYEDYDFNFILLLATKKTYHLDLPLIYYRLGSSTYCLT